MKQLDVIVVLMGDGTRTTAEALLTNTEDPDAPLVSGTGSAGRERGDKGNQAVGDDLATARALRSLAARLERRANGQVKHAESIKAHKAEIAERNAGDPILPAVHGYWKSNL